MRKLVSSTFLTMDGVMQAPGGPGEDEAGGFASGGWSVHHWDDVLNDAMTGIMGKPFDMLLGRKTYEIFAAYWPNATEPGADELNNAQKYVVTRTLNQVSWKNSHLVKGDVAEEVARLKAMDGPELQVHGSSVLLQTLLKYHLLDEMHILTFPVTVGAGKRLFGEGANPGSFKLTGSKVSPSGVVIATYQYSGELKTGTFG